MSAKRPQLNAPDELSLLNQVAGVCPECGKPLFYKKKKTAAHKAYEIAHIYPLNPTAAEQALLRDEERLGEGPNDLDNLIPLCLSCHGKFDKPRTIQDYQRLVATKKAAIAAAAQKELQHDYDLREEIATVVAALEGAVLSADPATLSLEAKSVDAKLDSSMPTPTRRKIQNNVNDYFVFVRQSFQALESVQPGVPEHISAQVRAYYLAQKTKGWSQQDIFAGVVTWIKTTAKAKSLEAAEIVASFFVQNCEVFE